MADKSNISILMRDGTEHTIEKPDLFGFTNGFLELDYGDRIYFIALDKIESINVCGLSYAAEEPTHIENGALVH